MVFKMKGFSAFTKKEEYIPQTQRKDIKESVPQSKKKDEEYIPQTKRVYLDNDYEVGDQPSEDDFEAQFKQKGDKAKNYPQLSVQDYSKVKKDNKGFYVTKLED